MRFVARIAGLERGIAFFLALIERPLLLAIGEMIGP